MNNCKKKGGSFLEIDYISHMVIILHNILKILFSTSTYSKPMKISVLSQISLANAKRKYVSQSPSFPPIT